MADHFSSSFHLIFSQSGPIHHFWHKRLFTPVRWFLSILLNTHFHYIYFCGADQKDNNPDLTAFRLANSKYSKNSKLFKLLRLDCFPKTVFTSPNIYITYCILQYKMVGTGTEFLIRNWQNNLDPDPLHWFFIGDNGIVERIMGKGPSCLFSNKSLMDLGHRLLRPRWANHSRHSLDLNLLLPFFVSRHCAWLLAMHHLCRDFWTLLGGWRLNLTQVFSPH